MSIRSLDGERGLTAQGFVDRATLNLTSYSLTVLDYKTGSARPGVTFQLGEYGHALLMAMGIAAEPVDRPILGRYWLARKGIYTDAVPVVTRHPLAELQYRYDAAARGTQARIFAPHVTNLCKSCSVVDYCPAQAWAQLRRSERAHGAPDAGAAGQEVNSTRVERDHALAEVRQAAAQRRRLAGARSTPGRSTRQYWRDCNARAENFRDHVRAERDLRPRRARAVGALAQQLAVDFAEACYTAALIITLPLSGTSRCPAGASRAGDRAAVRPCGSAPRLASSPINHLRAPSTRPAGPDHLTRH